MALVVNGDGNITGLSVGGLPTGVISASLIADGTIPYSKLLSTDWTTTQSGNGYQKLPTGLIIQWGATGTVGDATITFPIAFPSAVYSVTSVSDGANWCATNTVTTTTFAVQQRRNTSGYATATGIVRWIAIGI